MTEAEWLACDDPDRIFDYCREKSTDRKYLLFACACCRRIYHLLTDQRSRDSIEAAEWFADGGFNSEDLQEYHKRAEEALEAIDKEIDAQFPEGRGTGGRYYRAALARTIAARAGSSVSSGHRGYAVMMASSCAAKAITFASGADFHSQCPAYHEQTVFLRDIFGPLLFRPVPIAPAWRTSSVLSLAQTIYDERQFDKMPILGDALEDAGCTSQEILNHCRQSGEHVRGCWVVDAVLGRE